MDGSAILDQGGVAIEGAGDKAGGAASGNVNRTGVVRIGHIVIESAILKRHIGIAYAQCRGRRSLIVGEYYMVGRERAHTIEADAGAPVAVGGVSVLTHVTVTHRDADIRADGIQGSSHLRGVPGGFDFFFIITDESIYEVDTLESDVDFISQYQGCVGIGA